MLGRLKYLKKSCFFKFSQKNPYAQKMYEKWKQDPQNVHPSWQIYFQNTNIENQESEQKPDEQQKENHEEQEILKSVFNLTKHYRNYGHYLAQLDPLDHPRTNPWKEKMQQYIVEQEKFFTEEEMQKEIEIDSDFFPKQWKEQKKISPTQVIKDLNRMYADKIGFDYQQIQKTEIINWIQEKIESRPNFQFDDQHKIEILKQLQRYSQFIEFFRNTYKKERIYSCEGVESFVTGLAYAVSLSSKLGIKSIDIGMAHRGRLGVLSQVAQKPLHEIFAEFDQTSYEKFIDKPYLRNYEGDVTYHSSASSKIRFLDGNEIRINVSPNSSHHESINPVLLGSVKAKIDQRNWNNQTILPIIVHGDASICGQGIVYETQQLEQLDDFKVGGCVHIVINNQIGNTSPMSKTRCSFHPTNISNINRNFCIYVNSQEPELVDWAMQLAIEYRQKWQRDVFVELIGFRRIGHNDLQDQAVMHPITNHTINKIPQLYKSYFEKLKKQNLVTEENMEEWKQLNQKEFEKSFEISKNGDFILTENAYLEREIQYAMSKNYLTLKEENFKQLGQQITTLPQDYKFHKLIMKEYQQRAKSIETGEKIDWATAEGLAFANLLVNGYNVRLVGEDVERGTFSHRHAVVVDQKTNKKFIPLETILNKESKNHLVVRNSALSEFGVLGFETGYAINSPQSMVLWEAQFGDFTNGAQVIVDQYIATAEQKWGRRVGMVLLLPHGYDGQGPEHSNARIERFLGQVHDDFTFIQEDLENDKYSTFKTNMVVCNVTTSSNYYHMLIKQFKRNFRKPLVVMTPKKLLRSKLVHSNMEEFLDEKEFQKVIDDDMKDKSQVKKILVCSGKTYFDAKQRIEKENLQNKIAVIRLEQLAPFPYYNFNQIISKYPKDAQVFYFQEENYNFGPFTFIKPRINIILERNGFDQVQYIGRKISSQTSVGSAKKHQQEEQEILDKAVEIKQIQSKII